MNVSVLSYKIACWFGQLRSAMHHGYRDGWDGFTQARDGAAIIAKSSVSAQDKTKAK